MSDAQKAELTIAILISLIGGATVLWGLWHACWAIYDHLMGHWKRIKNKHFDATVGRDVYRFIKGVHH